MTQRFILHSIFSFGLFLFGLPSAYSMPTYINEYFLGPNCRSELKHPMAMAAETVSHYWQSTNKVHGLSIVRAAAWTHPVERKFLNINAKKLIRSEIFMAQTGFISPDQVKRLVISTKTHELTEAIIDMTIDSVFMSRSLSGIDVEERLDLSEDIRKLIIMLGQPKAIVSIVGRGLVPYRKNGFDLRALEVTLLINTETRQQLVFHTVEATKNNQE